MWQLVRIAHALDGSGPSREVLRDLQAAQRNNDLWPVVEIAAKKLLELCMATLEELWRSLLEVYTRLREHILVVQPFNGIINSPESVYCKPPTRYASNPRSPTHGETVVVGISTTPAHPDDGLYPKVCDSRILQIVIARSAMGNSG